MIKAVFFDLDGVLVDACNWHYEALNRALQEVANESINRDEHESTFNGLPTKIKLQMLFEAGRIKESDITKINELKQKFTLEVIDELCHRDKIKIEVMKYLVYEGFFIGCVTNCIRETASRMLEKTGVLEELGTLITNEDIERAKPHPDGYLLAMKDFNVFPEETLIVEEPNLHQMAASLAFVLIYIFPSQGLDEFRNQTKNEKIHQPSVAQLYIALKNQCILQLT